MSSIAVSDLNTSSLYLASASVVPGAGAFSRLISRLSRYVQDSCLESRMKGLPIVTHNLLLTYDEQVKKWLRHEVANNGAVTSILDENAPSATVLYVTELGTIYSDEKAFLKQLFNRDPNQKSLLTALIHYPFLKAFGSFEIVTPFLPCLGYTVNYLVDVLRDLWYFILSSVLRIKELPEYCTEKALNTVFALNFLRQHVKGRPSIKLPVKLLDKLYTENFKPWEIYPQDIIDNCPFLQLTKSETTPR